MSGSNERAGGVEDGHDPARAPLRPSATRPRPRGTSRRSVPFWSPRLAQDPARGPVLWTLLAIGLACAGAVALRWVSGKGPEPLVSGILLTVSSWLAALAASRGRLGRSLLASTPYLVAGLALTTLCVLQAAGDPADLVHTDALLGAYLALPVAYMLFFLVRPAREALFASIAACAALVAVQLALPPLLLGRSSSGTWSALIIGFWHGAVVLLLFAVPRLRSDRELLQAVMRSSRDAMVLLLPDGPSGPADGLSAGAYASFRVAFANAAAESVLGVRAGVRFAYGGASSASPELVSGLAAALEGQAEASFQVDLPTPDGPRWFRVAAAPSRSGVAATFVDVTELKETEGRALALAQTDELTGLANRRGFEVEAGRRFAAAGAGEAGLTLCYLDLDGFKDVNDRFGHGAGDELLRAVAERLRATVRATDLVARLGGDEFVILAGGLADDDVAPFFDRLNASFADPFTVAGRPVTVHPSLGVVPRAEELVDALAAADAAMYDAKRRGGGVVLAGPERRAVRA